MTKLLHDNAELIDSLAEHQFAVVEHYFSSDFVKRAQQDFSDLLKSQRFQTARVGSAQSRVLRDDIRTDETSWIDASQASEPQRYLLDCFEQLREDLNRSLYLNLQDCEAHYARYQSGAHYSRHRDAFNVSSIPLQPARFERVVSLVTYFNDHWKKADGGLLRLFWPSDKLGEQTVEVMPRSGTLVAFLSAEIEHEVTKAARERWSCAAWMRRLTTPGYSF